jgi:acyl-CoA synthetase (AMP-forming)/AMP-acid ligase II
MRPVDFFDRGAEWFPDRDFLVDSSGRRTYRQSQLLTHRIAAAMMKSGFVAGGKAAVYAPNGARAFECVLGLMRAGGVWVPVNARNAAEENASLLHGFDVEFLFYHSSVESEVRVIKGRCPAILTYVCLDAKSDLAASDFAAGFDDWIADAPSGRVDVPEDPDAAIGIFPTGGTTGTPKGAVWGIRQFETQVASFFAAMPPRKVPIHLVAAPLTHAAGAFALILSSAGATHVVLPRAEPLLILEAIQRERVSYLYLPPTAIYMLLAHPRVREFDFGSLEYFMYGGAPMAVEKLRGAISAFGPVMAQTYGQMEAPGFCTYLSPSDHVAALASDEKRLASCGRATLLTRVGIMDDQGNLLPQGEVGEIVVRGGLVMQGYYKNAEATAQVSKFGWHQTGDLGCKDDRGYVYIVDRKRDMIISGGFNVYPSEIEQVLWSHAAVQDCAVIGVPDDKWGEAVKAVVELNPGASVQESELIALCKERLGGVKAPKSVEFWPALPRTAAGKVSKKNVRERFWGDRSRKV